MTTQKNNNYNLKYEENDILHSLKTIIENKYLTEKCKYIIDYFDNDPASGLKALIYSKE